MTACKASTHELRHTLTGGETTVLDTTKMGKLEEIQIQASGIKAWSLENSGTRTWLITGHQSEVTLKAPEYERVEVGETDSQVLYQ